MKARHIFPVLCALLALYELWAIWTPAAGDTISEQIWFLADVSAVIPFAFGVLMGHFFWGRQ